MRWTLAAAVAVPLLAILPGDGAAQNLAWDICEIDPSVASAPGDCDTTVKECPICGELCSPLPPPCDEVPDWIAWLFPAELDEGFTGIREFAIGLPPGLGEVLPEHTAILEKGAENRTWPLFDAGDEEATYATLMPVGGHRWSRFIDEGATSGMDSTPVYVRIVIDPSEGLPNSPAWLARALRQMVVGLGAGDTPQQLVSGLSEGMNGCRKLEQERFCSLLRGRELAACKSAVRDACDGNG